MIKVVAKGSHTFGQNLQELQGFFYVLINTYNSGRYSGGGFPAALLTLAGIFNHLANVNEEPGRLPSLSMVLGNTKVWLMVTKKKRVLRSEKPEFQFQLGYGVLDKSIHLFHIFSWSITNIYSKESL